MIKKILCSLSIGCILSFFFIWNDKPLHDWIGTRFSSVFKTTFDCNFLYDSARVSFFPLQICFNTVSVSPIKKPNDWSWGCDRLVGSCSWLHLLSCGTVDAHLDFVALSVTSNTRNGLPIIAEHLRRMNRGSSLPVYIKYAKIHQGKAFITVAEGNGLVTYKFEGELFRNNESVTTCTRISNIICTVHDKICAKQGTMIVNSCKRATSFEATVSGSLFVPQLPETDCLCSVFGSWKNGTGVLAIKNNNGSFSIDPITIGTIGNKLIASCNVDAPLSYLFKLFDHANDEIVGNCSIRLLTNLNDLSQRIDGNILFKDCQYDPFIRFSQARCSFSRRGHQWHGGISWYNSPHFELGGFWKWNNEQKVGHVEFKNRSRIELPFISYWHTRPHDCVIRIGVDGGSKQVRGTFTGVVRNSKTEGEHNIAGTINGNEQTMIIQGNVGTHTYSIDTKITPSISFNSFVYRDAEENTLLEIMQSTEEKNIFSGLISFPLMHILMKNMTGHDLHGEGKLGINGEIDDTSIHGQVHLIDGIIRLPKTYNFVTDFNGTFFWDRVKRTCIFQDISFDMCQGSIQCTRAVACFGVAGYKPSFIHVPLLFNSCLFNYEEDLFSHISGYIVLSKDTINTLTASGALILERSHLKKNIFTQSLRRSASSFPHTASSRHEEELHYNIRLETREPIAIVTSFLNTEMSAALLVEGTTNKPIISGTLTCMSGKILFPYKPLYLTKGTVQFLSNQWDDPLIKFVAQGKVKKYNVAMRTTGSLKKPEISFSSSPPLTEQQIIALLLSGSHEESFNGVVPVLLVQNIKSILFDSAKFDTVFKRMLRPFRHVRVVPSFSNQTGRGGIRALLEIEMSDHWRVVAQKNFSLPEDTRFELEYLLSDDLAIRWFRDERRSVGSEIEWRWKR